jgi:hypothetical protein
MLLLLLLLLLLQLIVVTRRTNAAPPTSWFLEHWQLQEASLAPGIIHSALSLACALVTAVAVSPSVGALADALIKDWCV